MARHWRLRHKLVLGLALVVGSVALLLGGALFGLSSYTDTMHTTQRKLDEMQVVASLRVQIEHVGVPDPQIRKNQSLSKLDIEKAEIEGPAHLAQQILSCYKTMLADGSVRHGLDPDNGEEELARIERMEKEFAALDGAVARATGAGVGGDTPRLMDDESVKVAQARLVNLSGELFDTLVTDAKYSFIRSNGNHRRSLYIVGSATALAIVFVFTLLYYFRVWVFAPIKQLQAGVRRVRAGEFEQPIRLGSKDELEELANEFNAMTARLRDVYADLARQVNERTRQLVRSERMVSVGFLAAGVAHEINNPLASIAFCAEALERRLQDVLARAPGESEVILKYLKMMQDESQRCKQITQKLLDFSRSGGRREPTDLTQLVQDVIEVANCLPTARSKHIQFVSDGHPVAPVRVPEVKGVVLNVVVNALESMEDGGRLAVSLTSAGEFAELKFVDSGCGMTAEVLENIFEPFFTRSRTGNGTGLGLATSHLIIDQHGGTITAASAGPGKGSTFTVRLPLRAADGRNHDTGDRGPQSGRGEATLLPFPPARVAAA